MNTNRPVNLENPAMVSLAFAVPGFIGANNGLIRRVSAIVLTAYALVILISGATYCDLFIGSSVAVEQWQFFINQPWVRVLSLLAILAVVLQAWMHLAPGLAAIRTVKLRALSLATCSVVAVTYAALA